MLSLKLIATGHLAALAERSESLRILLLNLDITEPVYHEEKKHIKSLLVELGEEVSDGKSGGVAGIK